MDRLINILATVTLVELMICIGIGVTVAQVIHSAGDWRLMSRALLANYLLVPGAAVALLLLFRTPPKVAAAWGRMPAPRVELPVGAGVKRPLHRPFAPHR